MKFRMRAFFGGVVVSTLVWISLFFFLYGEVSQSQDRFGGGRPMGVLPINHLKSKFSHQKQPADNERKLKYEAERWKNEIDSDGLEDKRILLDKLKNNRDKFLDNKKKHHFSPEKQEIDNGKIQDEQGIIRNPEEKLMRDEGMKKHAFNELVSERLGFHRNITDTRNSL